MQQQHAPPASMRSSVLENICWLLTILTRSAITLSDAAAASAAAAAEATA